MTATTIVATGAGTTWDAVAIATGASATTTVADTAAADTEVATIALRADHPVTPRRLEDTELLVTHHHLVTTRIARAGATTRSEVKLGLLDC